MLSRRFALQHREGKTDWLTARVLRTRVNLIKLLHVLACPLLLNLKTIAALVNYSGAPRARLAPYLRLVIHPSEKFGNRVTVQTLKESEGSQESARRGGGGGCYRGSTRAPRFCSYHGGRPLWFYHNRLWLTPGEFNMAVIKQKRSRTRKKRPQ